MAALIGYALNETLAHDEIAEWGWRIPFFIGCLIIPLIFRAPAFAAGDRSVSAA